MADDVFNLDRFVKAQAPVIDVVLQELTAGRKRSHWMWFIFPQLRGLGHSPTAQFYGLSSLWEAQAFIEHPLLGPRLEVCTRAVLNHHDRSLAEIFNSPDDMKFRSSMTLFALTGAGSETPFHRALEQWCEGCGDAKTLALVGITTP